MNYLTQFFHTKEYLDNKNYIIKRFNELKIKYKDLIFKTHGIKDVKLYFNNCYYEHASWSDKGISISNFILVNPLTTIDELEDTICHEFAHAITKSFNHTKGWLNNFKRIFEEENPGKENIYRIYCRPILPPFLKKFHGKCEEGCKIETEEIEHQKCFEHNKIIRYNSIF